ncbi:MAG: glycosyltransferase family 2 protein, partial [Nitrosopumilaceae archaeon]
MIQLKSRFRRLLTLARFSSNAIHEYGFRFFISSAFLELRKYRSRVFAPESEGTKIRPLSEESVYMSWLHNHHATPEITSIMRICVQQYTRKPKFTIILSVNEKNSQYLKESFFSVIRQSYTNWELYINSSIPTSKEISDTLDTIPDSHIIIRPKLKQTNSLKEALLRASGDFIAFVNCGSILTPDALFRVVQLNQTQDADIIYSDEDQITISGDRKNPFFKPDWSLYLFLSFDYISNFYIVKSKLLHDSVTLKDDSGEAKHYDLLLRLSENTKKIFHIPTVLVSVREDSNLESTNNFGQNAEKAVSETLVRRGVNGKVTKGLISNTFRVSYFLDKEPRVTIIIPTKNNRDLLHRCITSIKNKTSYKNYEIIIIDNNSTREDTVSYIKSLPYTVIKYDAQFNFSKMNNLAVSRASGDYLLFLNDDTAPLESNWLSEMVSICELDDVGVVGAKLVHGNNTIQHAGIALLKTGAGFHPLQGVNSKSPDYFGFLNVIRDCSAVTGACLLIKKKIFEEVGGFDEKFDLYYGDTDLCMKVRKHGCGVVYTPYAVLLHQGSRTIKEYATAFFTVENYCHFIKKWPPLKLGDPFYNPNLGWDYRINIEDDIPIEKEFIAEKQEMEKLLPSLSKMYSEFLDSTYKEIFRRPVDSKALERYLP